MADLATAVRPIHSNPCVVLRAPGCNIFADPWVMGCGVGMMEQMPYSNNWTWERHADVIAGLYRALYTCGNTLYAIPDYMLNYPFQKSLVEMGAKQIDEFPNLYHGPSTMHVFRVNVRNAVGRFCDKYGDPLPSKPENPPEPYEHKFEQFVSGEYNNLPKKA